MMIGVILDFTDKTLTSVMTICSQNYKELLGITTNYPYEIHHSIDFPTIGNITKVRAT